STTAAYRRQQIGVRLSGCFSPLLGASTTAASSPHSSPQKSPQFQSPSRGFNDCSQSKSLIVSWGRLRFSPLLGASTTAAEQEWGINPKRLELFQSPSRGFNDCSLPKAADRRPPFWLFQSPSRGFNDCSLIATLIATEITTVSVPFSGLQRLQPIEVLDRELGEITFQSPSRGFNDCSLPKAADRRPPFWLFQSPSRGFNDCSLIATLIATEITTVSVPFSGLQRLQPIEVLDR